MPMSIVQAVLCWGLHRQKARQGGPMLGQGVPAQPGGHLTALPVWLCLHWSKLFESTFENMLGLPTVLAVFPCLIESVLDPCQTLPNLFFSFDIQFRLRKYQDALQSPAVSSSVSDFYIFHYHPLLLKVTSSVSRSKSLFALPSPALAHP